MSNDSAFSRKQLIVAIVAGLLLNVAYHGLVPGSTRIASRDIVVEWSVPLLLCLGGFALFRGRASDLEHYKSIAPNTEETRSRLEKRYRLLGVAGWVLTGAGAIRTAVILFHHSS